MATQTPLTSPSPTAPIPGQNLHRRLAAHSGGSHPQTGAAVADPEGARATSEHSAAGLRRTALSSDGEFRTLAEAGKDAGESGPGLRLSAAMERLPVILKVAIPVRDFRVRHLLALGEGEVIASEWANGDDLPLSSGNVQLAWTEFEVADTRLAVRVTRLA